MDWSKDIINDIYYQRKMQSSKIASFLINNWFVWNKLCVLISLIINVIMLSTWEAPNFLQNDYDETSPPKNLPKNMSE